MAVLIEGMEMPKNCGWCPLRASCVHRIYMECRPEDCPLIEVPEPHGRLIDADAIPYKKIMYDGDDFYYGVTKPYIDRIPTVIPESKEG